MKQFFKKQALISIAILAISIVVILLNLWILSTKLKWPNDDLTMFLLARDLSGGDAINIFSFVITILFYVSLLPSLLLIISVIKKKNQGLIFNVMYQLGYNTTVIVFQSVFSELRAFATTLIIINIVLLILYIILYVFRFKALSDLNVPIEEEDEPKQSSKIPFMVLLLDIVALLILASTFVIPMYSEINGSQITHAILIQTITQGTVDLTTVASFFIYFAIFLTIILDFAQTLTSYFNAKAYFVKKSNQLIFVIFTITVIYFISGFVMDIVLTLTTGANIQTFAYIPMLLMIVLLIENAVLKGKYITYQEIVKKEKITRYGKVEPLVYVIMLSAVSVLMLFLKIIRFEIISGGYSYFVNLTGFNILQDYPILDPAYRIVAYVLVVMLMSVGLALIISVVSYLSKYSKYDKIVKATASINVFFVFIIAISGYYFQIAKAINQSILLDLAEYYGVNIPGLIDFDYIIKTDAIYALIASTTILSLMFFRRAFDREDLNPVRAEIVSNDESQTNNDKPSAASLAPSDEIMNIFDPSPALTELDQKVELFKKDLEYRKSYQVKETSLNELILFVVDYAKNSRLHLSYSPEDIATFVAGLGATKLSVLQGMSGTGKTSLPKIFSEAILGNCDIIEVESSWKDKNELLGYYNEFSMKYTPKKFTLALYKAALNPEIFTFILLDEMNLSRIEYYFSDFLSLMENEEGYREIKLINLKLSRKEEDQEVDYLALDQGHTLKVPSNVWFIGTANRDESTFVISDKVYDRAHTMNFTKRAPKVRNYTDPISQRFYDYQTMNQLLMNAKKQGTFDAENNELIKHVESLLAPFNISFGNRILKQIEDFVNIYTACFPKEDVLNEAIEKILLSKVVAKLEVKTIDDKDKLEMAFEKLGLSQCATFIRHLDSE